MDEFEIYASENSAGKSHKSVAVNEMDTNGSQQFRALEASWIEEGNIFMLCFAVNNKRSWDNVVSLRERVVHKMGDDGDYAMLLVGLKCDLLSSDPGNEFVKHEVIIAQAKEWDLPYIETSAEDNRNCHFLLRVCVYEYWWQSHQKRVYVQ